MGYTVKLLPKVYQDLCAAKNWYNNQKEFLGEEFKIEIKKEIDYIGEFPEHYQRVYKELRQSLVERFPYVIYYLINEDKNEVIIFGILHTSRNPKIIQERTEKLP